MSKTRYVVGVDVGGPNGDATAVVVVRQDPNGTIWMIDEASSLDDDFYEHWATIMVRRGRLPIDVTAQIVEDGER